VGCGAADAADRFLRGGLGGFVAPGFAEGESAAFAGVSSSESEGAAESLCSEGRTLFMMVTSRKLASARKAAVPRTNAPTWRTVLRSRLPSFREILRRATSATFLSGYLISTLMFVGLPRRMTDTVSCSVDLSFAYASIAFEGSLRSIPLIDWMESPFSIPSMPSRLSGRMP
jgi:hypothetical protein